MRFADHKYEWTKPFMSVRHCWSLRGPRGGIHFHVSITPNYDPNAGLEFHRNFDPTNGQEAAQHKNCWLCGGPCWHDGTSLYASERVWPLVEPYLIDGDHETIFRLLETEYDEHFARFATHPTDQRRG